MTSPKNNWTSCNEKNNEATKITIKKRELCCMLFEALGFVCVGLVCAGIYYGGYYLNYSTANSIGVALTILGGTFTIVAPTAGVALAFYSICKHCIIKK